MDFFKERFLLTFLECYRDDVQRLSQCSAFAACAAPHASPCKESDLLPPVPLSSSLRV